MRKAGDRLRVTAQLVNAADGYHLWSERFDRQLEDVFAVQDEITLAIVEALRVRLLGGERDRLLKRSTEKQEAFTLYLKARHHLHTFTTAGLRQAARFSRQARRSP